MTDLSNIKALAWDIGGTVFDWHHTIRDEVAGLAEAQGVELDAPAFTNQWRFTMVPAARARPPRRPALAERRPAAPSGARRGAGIAPAVEAQLRATRRAEPGLASAQRLARLRRRPGGAAQPLHRQRADRDVVGDRRRLLEAQRHLLGRHSLLRVPQPLQARPRGLRGRRPDAGAAPRPGDDVRRPQGRPQSLPARRHGHRLRPDRHRVRRRTRDRYDPRPLVHRQRHRLPRPRHPASSPSARTAAGYDSASPWLPRRGSCRSAT